MTMKFKLDSLDGLDEATKKLYKQSGDKFVLDVDGEEEGDLAGLKNKVNELLADNKKMREALTEGSKKQRDADAAARRAAEEAAAKSGDIESIRKSADERVAQAEREAELRWKPQVDKATAALRKTLVTNVAVGLAAKLATPGQASILVPFIEKRLDVEELNGELVTVVRDAKGSASALTLQDLEKEFIGNQTFAPIIAGSKASGSAAPNGGESKPSGGATGAKTVTRAEYDAMSAAAKYAHNTGGGVITDS